MATRLLLPIHDAPRLTDTETDILCGVVAAGAGALASLDPRDAALRERMGGASRFLYRRWVLEILLVLRARGAMAYNDVSRALGRLAGESLAPKLQALEREGLVARAPSPKLPRVRYELTALGAPVANGAFALTSAKREHVRALIEPAHERALVAGLAHAAGEDALARYERGVDAFAQAYLARAEADAEPQLRLARRFSEACVRKWHGELLSTLALAGPLRFSELRGAIGPGDQALANALAALTRLESIERAEGAWRVTPLGRVDVCIGGALLLLLPGVRS